ncbi:MAG: hypothetical protein C5B54_11690 [Acidobacteria bacterium]|nr:MAG: hypothetical protein C5B54_11690 [Acidobacteriota bacterium]
MEQRGSLADKNVLELLMEWHRQKRTGSIVLRRKQIEKIIYLRNGLILRAQSNQENEKLGQILLKKNLVSTWDLEVAVSQLKPSEKRLGQILTGMSAIKESVLNNTLVSQSRDIIFSIIDWEDGEYFLDENTDLTKEIQFEQLYTPEIILQGMRRISNIVLLLRPLGDLQAKLKLAADYLEKIRKITLLSEEKSILALLHKPSTLKDIISASGMEKLTVYRSVAALLSVGVIVQEDRPSGREGIDNAGGFRTVGAPATTLPALKIKHRKQLGEMLVEQHVVTEEQLKEALHMQGSGKGKKQLLGNVLMQLGYASENAIVDCLSTQLNIRKVENIEVADEVLRLIPFNLAKKYFVCPVRRLGSALEVAMLDPTNMAALDDLSFVTGYKIRPVIASNDAMKAAWKTYYGKSEEKALEKFERKDEPKKHELTYHALAGKEEDEDDSFEEGLSEEISSFILDEDELQNLVSGVVEELQVVKDDGAPPVEQVSVDDAPIVKLVNTILRQAISLAASDIHIEPWENKLQIRFRLDGVLHRVMSLPLTITSALTSRVKIISGMDIAERRRPQDGRVKLRIGKRRAVDYRVSVVPTVFGERVVLRVLDRSSLQIDLTKLGFDGSQLEHFQKAIQQPYGMILCTGPTGSGKTTTLYSALNSLDHSSNNILTVEDPVEYNFPGVGQVQVNEGTGVTFAAVLRSFLRQDPDIMMVGEIRDPETAEICAKAALTGHLVLSTVHTNDAPSAVGRLVDLGLKPYLVSASLLMVIAQRLLRKICKHCRTEVTVDKQVLINAGMREEEAERVVLFKGRGCEYCGNTGFSGRSGIYEIMPVTRRIKSAIAADLPSDQIKDIALSEGMKDLRRCALEKVIAGVTSLEEAIQNTLTQ